MTNQLNIALAQYNPTLGDFAGNAEKIRSIHAEVVAKGADLVVFPEMSISGYPPEDLALGPSFIAACKAAVEGLLPLTKDGPAIVIGSVWIEAEHRLNALLLLEKGRILALRGKHELPNYLVFDEKRLFHAGPLPEPVVFNGVRVGLLNCEDMWHSRVSGHLKANGAELLICASASPFSRGKQGRRYEVARQRVEETGLPMLYLNQLGGQDSLVFDGGSFAMQDDGQVVVNGPRFAEHVAMITCRQTDVGWRLDDGERTPSISGDAEIYAAMVLGLRDYVNKNRFPGVVLGMSGGIDSALSAAVAVDALGPERVHCVMLPSRFTSDASTEDATACAKALGASLDAMPIEPSVTAFESSLTPIFGHEPAGLTHENLQARVRGVALMAISNETGAMLLTTGNKSEMAVGYATIYGDMNGGYSVLKDVYKTTVYRLARWRNAQVPVNGLGPSGAVIPERIITKAPTADLRPDQKDEDSLPSYDMLDAILYALVEEQRSVAEVAAQGFERETVEKVQNLLYAAEYKRRQAPPGVRISRRAFERDRRYPMTNRFRP